MFLYYKQGKIPSLPIIEKGIIIKKNNPHPIVPNMGTMQMGRKRLLYFKIMTFLCRGFHRVLKEYDLIIDNKIVSKAVLISKVPIYKFLPNNGIHLCYCETLQAFRGKGYYPLLLKYIQNDNIDEDLYMVVDENNVSSIKGIEKAGFIKYAQGRKINNRYFVIDEYLD